MDIGDGMGSSPFEIPLAFIMHLQWMSESSSKWEKKQALWTDPRPDYGETSKSPDGCLRNPLTRAEEFSNSSHAKMGHPLKCSFKAYSDWLRGRRSPKLEKNTDSPLALDKAAPPQYWGRQPRQYQPQQKKLSFIEGVGPHEFKYPSSCATNVTILKIWKAVLSEKQISALNVIPH